MIDDGDAPDVWYIDWFVRHILGVAFLGAAFLGVGSCAVTLILPGVVVFVAFDTTVLVALAFWVVGAAAALGVDFMGTPVLLRVDRMSVLTGLRRLGGILNEKNTYVILGNSIL